MCSGIQCCAWTHSWHYSSWTLWLECKRISCAIVSEPHRTWCIFGVSVIRRLCQRLGFSSSKKIIVHLQQIFPYKLLALCLMRGQWKLWSLWLTAVHKCSEKYINGCEPIAKCCNQSQGFYTSYVTSLSKEGPHSSVLFWEYDLYAQNIWYNR